ncbi:class I SAM-dependent methyltransferase [Aerococcus sp. Group 1]|uniref:class I SAM-dependent methyltransferase n=1 Tax=Aerococcus urinae (strain CCUG 59500 / ACS-120-V-Col10a) TaxID=2976812 RepID=UPI00227D683D|nr:methyltransferase domain-containing protein [Aerococcus sp. Group 1]MCY3061331.1 class I SAM-dependent methyltransferase [Aerococcus sp. Group 1]
MKLEQIREVEKNNTDPINNFFDYSYYKIYSKLLNIELDLQSEFLEKNYLNKLPKINTLDLCCGTGRHIKKLNRKGYLIDGVDINPDAVVIANKSTELGKIYLADIQYFKPIEKYDFIYSMESSIGYLPDKQTIDILKNLESNILSDNGIFLLHLINKDYLIKNLTPRVWFGEHSTGYLLEDRRIDAELDKVILFISAF